MKLQVKRELIKTATATLTKAVPAEYRPVVTSKMNSVVKNPNTKEYGLFYAVLQIINTAYKFPFKEASDYDREVHLAVQAKILKAFKIEAFDLDSFDTARGYHTFINQDDGVQINGVKPKADELLEIVEYLASIFKVKGKVLDYNEQAWNKAEQAILDEIAADEALLAELQA